MIDKKSGILDHNLRANPAIGEITTAIEAIEKDGACYQEKSFDKRARAIDFIEFPIIDQIEELAKTTAQPAQLLSLKHRAEKIKARLEHIDNRLFKKLREKIRTGGYSRQGFKSLVNKYVEFNLNDNELQEAPGYDNLDLFINGFFPIQSMPEQTRDLEPEMVYYQKTPARIVFELVEKAGFTKEDVFFDIGSGLGHVAIMVSLLIHITVKGVEFEPSFCDYARACATDLNLTDVIFINADARKADYSDGTVFFLFTPFRGEMLKEVLELLKAESLNRKIKIITYGPCSAQVALQNWLYSPFPVVDDVYNPVVFISL